MISELGPVDACMRVLGCYTSVMIGENFETFHAEHLCCFVIRHIAQTAFMLLILHRLKKQTNVCNK